jgi:hypothetical protein
MTARRSVHRSSGCKPKQPNSYRIRLTNVSKRALYFDAGAAEVWICNVDGSMSFLSLLVINKLLPLCFARPSLTGFPDHLARPPDISARRWRPHPLRPRPPACERKSRGFRPLPLSASEIIVTRSDKRDTKRWCGWRSVHDPARRRCADNGPVSASDDSAS